MVKSKVLPDILKIDAKEEINRITREIRLNITNNLKKRGVVVGTSGGIDSSVVLVLCTKAIGNERVLAVLMPEKESSPESVTLALELISKLNVSYIIQDITPILEAFGCYKKRDEAVRRIFPEYAQNYKVKITIPQNTYENDRLNFFQVTIISPDGEEKTSRLPLKEYLEIVAASNLKQRTRMSLLYLNAECHNYAVAGTGNKNEHELGFFVKYGDGGADIKPIVRLFKTEVYQIAEYLEIPESIRKRIPTTDTYSAEQTQEEFFFGTSFELLDYIWHNWELGVNAEDIAEGLNLSAVRVRNIINDLVRKIQNTEYLRKEPIHL